MFPLEDDKNRIESSTIPLKIPYQCSLKELLFRRKLNIDRIASRIGCHLSTKLSKVTVHCFAHFVNPKLRLNCLIAYIKYFVTFFRILLKLQYNCWERLLISNDISFYLFTDNEVLSLITCCAGSCFTAIWRSYTISAGNNNSH